MIRERTLFAAIFAASLAACTGASPGGPAGDDDTTGGDDDAPGHPVTGLGEWTGHDHVPWSQSPPFGLHPDQVPQFVSFGFDDNGYSGLPESNGTGGFAWST